MHTMVVRRAIKRHVACGGHCPAIQPGEFYIEHKEFPGSDVGYADAAGHPVRMAECRKCAERYGRGDLIRQRQEKETIMTRAVDEYFLPGVSFTIDGEAVPAHELAWVMYAACGCICALHMITVDTINETAAWTAMSGNAHMIKQDKARGHTIKMVKHKGLPLDDCPHSPKWGYIPTPIPPGYSWATHDHTRCQHLVPLTAAPEPDKNKKKDPYAHEPEWVEDDGGWRTRASLCGKSTEPVRVWSRKWWRMHHRHECSRCAKIAESHALPLNVADH